MRRFFRRPTMTEKYRYFFGIAVMVLQLVGCGPIYDTRYTFTPPANETGRVCVNQCENSRFQCQQLIELYSRQCEDMGRREQQRCQWQLALQGKKEKWYDCPSPSCDSDTSRCDEQYRGCYQACGGRIDAQTVCVMNCQQAVPQTPPATPYSSDGYRRY